MTSYLLVSQGRSTSPPSRSAVHTQPWAWLQTARRITSCGSTDARDYFSGAQSNFPAGSECAVCDCVVCACARAVQKFFRRGLVESPTYSCKLGGNCVINPRTRNACRYCRFRKCLESGMSRGGTRALIAYTGSCLVGEARRLVAVLDCCVYDS